MYGESEDELIISGNNNELSIIGTMNQLTGETIGNLTIGNDTFEFIAIRSINHDIAINTCRLCHDGDPYPLPKSHVAVQWDTPNCLSCHRLMKNHYDF